MSATTATPLRPASRVDSPYAWVRLVATALLGTIGGVGLWSVVVALPAVQAEFGVARADASLPYTMATVGFMLGTVLMGRLADRYGIIVPLVISAFALSAGYVGASYAETLWQFALVHGVLIGGLGSCAVFAPLVADASRWFERRRGIAVAVAACGSYFAGAAWPPVLQALIAAYGWRQAHLLVGLFCLATMLPLILVFRRPVPQAALPRTAAARAEAAAAAARFAAPLGLRPNALQALLMVAGVACCVAMAMPQVHIVAYCVDLGYGPARGAEMLALMLATGVVSRLGFGLIMDRIGAARTLVIGSFLQAAALALFLPFDGLVSLYVISAIFGLFQGGLVPSYAILVRQFFPAGQAATRVGLVISATLAGMALGGWMTGLIFDATGSYDAAIVNGLLWNGLNLAIAVWLLLRIRAEGRRLPPAGGGAPAAAAAA
jgi:MFS family permease